MLCSFPLSTHALPLAGSQLMWLCSWGHTDGLAWLVWTEDLWLTVHTSYLCSVSWKMGVHFHHEKEGNSLIFLYKMKMHVIWKYPVYICYFLQHVMSSLPFCWCYLLWWLVSFLSSPDGDTLTDAVLMEYHDRIIVNKHYCGAFNTIPRVFQECTSLVLLKCNFEIEASLDRKIEWFSY